MRETCSPDCAARTWRWFRRAANPSAPTSGTFSVTEAATRPSRARVASSSASVAITR